MKVRSLSVAAVVLAAGCGPVTDPDDDALAETAAEPWSAFHVPALRQQQSAQGTTFFEAAADSIFRFGLLHRDAGQSLGLITHFNNVLYYVAAGSALLSTESEEVQLEFGSLAFVRGGVEHRFRSIAAELDVVTVFSQRVPIPQDPELVAFSLEEMVADRDVETNVWTGLLQTSSLSAGMYMLPKGGRDESLLTHSFDEFKITVSGGGRFDIGADGLEVSPGWIARIGSGVRHGYRRVSDDLDVLVIWGR